MFCQRLRINRKGDLAMQRTGIKQTVMTAHNVGVLTPEQRAAISRLNGAKSRGPITPAGKAVSSMNALKHGLTSRQIVVDRVESEKEFRRFSGSLRSHFKPTTIEEALWVDRFISCMWRARRGPLQEALLIEASNEEIFKTTTSDAYLPKNLESLHLIVTYEERMIKQAQTALREIERLRGVKVGTPTTPLPSPSISVINSPD